MDWEGRDFDDFAQDLRPPSPPHPLEPAEGWAGTRSVLSDPRLAAILSTPQGFPDFQNSQLAELLDFENRVAAELAIRRRELQEAMNPWFGELALLVQDPQAYPLVVEKLVRAEDLQQSDLAEIVNPQLAMVVTLAFQKSRLREATIKNPGQVDVIAGSLNPLLRSLLQLENSRKTILEAISGQIDRVAPNIGQIVGPILAASLVAKAGGLDKLAKIPACNLQALAGRTERIRGVAGRPSQQNHGEFGSLKVVLDADEEDRPKLVKLIANAVAKVARIDAAKLRRDGSVGRDLLRDLLQKFEKSKAPKLGQVRKPLPIPDDGPKKRRGGRKFRRAKDKLALTEARLAQNRIRFGAAFNDAAGVEADRFGMLAQMDSGKLRTHKKIQKGGLTKQQQARLKQESKRNEEFAKGAP